MQRMTIGKLSALSGLTVDTIRFYERRGLVEPVGRTEAGYRLYDADAPGRLAFVTRAKLAGFTLDDIRRLLTIRDNPDETCDSVYTHAVQKHDDLVAKIGQLETMRQTLTALTERCSGGGPLAGCPILGSLDGR